MGLHCKRCGSEEYVKNGMMRGKQRLEGLSRDVQELQSARAFWNCTESGVLIRCGRGRDPRG